MNKRLSDQLLILHYRNEDICKWLNEAIQNLDIVISENLDLEQLTKIKNDWDKILQTLEQTERKLKSL